MQEQSRKTLAAEEGSAGIQFVDKKNKGEELFQLDGKESFSDNTARFSMFKNTIKGRAESAWSADDTDAKQKLGSPRSTPASKPAASARQDETLSLTGIERQSVRKPMEEVSGQLYNIGNRLSEGGRLGQDAKFKPLLYEAANAAQDLIDTGTPIAQRISRMDKAMDALIKQAEERGLSDQVKNKLSEIKDSYADVRSLSEKKSKDKKVGYSGALSGDVRSAALAAVDPMIRGQNAESRMDGSPDAPRQIGNTLSTGSDRTV